MTHQSESLPVEIFEEFMLAGVSADFPMSFVFELELDEPLDTDRLQAALKSSLLQHPLLSSVLDWDRKAWRFDRPAKPKILERWGDEASQFDLTTETGFRMVISKSDAGRQNIGFVFHHACTDGLGAVGFIKDVAAAYNSAGSNQELSNGMDSVGAVQYLRRSRNAYGRNRVVHLLRWPLDLLGMLWSFEMVFNRPVPIEPATSTEAGSPEAAAGSRVADFLSGVLSPEETRLARQNCKSAGQTLNDRIMSSLFWAAQEWNDEFNIGHKQSLIRLMIPMNLRAAAPESAANMVAMVNFDRKVNGWNSIKWFQKVLRLEMTVVKRMRAGVTANRFLLLQKMFLGRWPMQDKQDLCLASCIFSNLGDLTHRFGETLHFGESRPVDLRIHAPLRQQTNVFVVVFSFANRLRFNVTFNARVLDEFHIEFLLESLKRHLLRSSD